MSSGAEERTAAVLAEHYVTQPRGYAGEVCTCGWEADLNLPPENQEFDHQAAMLAAANLLAQPTADEAEGAEREVWNDPIDPRYWTPGERERGHSVSAKLVSAVAPDEREALIDHVRMTVPAIQPGIAERIVDGLLAAGFGRRDAIATKLAAPTLRTTSFTPEARDAD